MDCTFWGWVLCKYKKQHNVAMPQLITENVTTLSPQQLFSCSLARGENYGHDHRLTPIHVYTRHKL